MKKEVNILNCLFICILINIIPTAALKTLQVPENIYTLLNGTAFIIQTGIMIFALKERAYKISRESMTVLMLIIGTQMLTQVINYIRWGAIIMNDMVHIASVIINVYFFVLCTKYFEIEKKDLIQFMKKIVILGVIASLYNVLMNITSMLNISNLTSSYGVSFSSFFPNRNQFGIFLIIAVASNLYLIKESNKKRYGAIQVFFIINLILTMSRASMLGLAVLYFVKFYMEYNSNNWKISKNKFIMLMTIYIIVVVAIIFLLLEGTIIEMLDNLFFRTDNLQSGSGRFAVWSNGIQIATKYNFLTGAGRFKAVELNNIEYNSPLEYFHSLYIETFATYGVIGVILLIVLLNKIFEKIKKSDKDEGIKVIMYASMITFLIISIFETTTRFSIGYADTISMIYFVTVPLICTNKIKQ